MLILLELLILEQFSDTFGLIVGVGNKINMSRECYLEMGV